MGFGRIILLAALAGFSSCTSYYYSTMDSQSVNVGKNADGIFEAYGDSLVTISYDFSGENAPVKVTVHNKTRRTLYVDWNKSGITTSNAAISFGGHTTDLADAGALLNADANDYYGIFEINNPSDKKNHLGLDKIPPYSKATCNKINFKDFPFIEYPKKRFEKEGIAFSLNGREVKGIEFSPLDSPISFNTCITVVDPRNGTPALYTYRQKFYLSRVARSGHKLHSDTDALGGDMFYVKVVRGRTAAAIGLVAVGEVGQLLINRIE